MAINKLKIGDPGAVLISYFNDNFEVVADSGAIQPTDDYNNSSFYVAGKTYLIKTALEINNITIPNNFTLVFEGGSFTKKAGGSGLITFTGEINIQSDQVCLYDITIATTNGRKIINADWFDLEKQTNAQYNAKTIASTTKNNTFLTRYNNFTINWGYGIYVFSGELNNLAHNHIGKGKYNTCLYFPNSKGIVYTSTKIRLKNEDIFIKSLIFSTSSDGVSVGSGLNSR